MDEPSHNSSMKKVISGLSHQEKQPPIIEILKYYQQSDSDIHALLIGDETDHVNIALQFARLACDQTKLLLPIGRGNVYEDIIKSNGISHMNTDIIRATLECVSLDVEGAARKVVRKEYYLIIKELRPNEENKVQMATDLMRFMVRSHLALRYQSGACNEQSLIVIQCLFELKRKLGDQFNNVVQDIRIVRAGPPTDHMFVEMDVRDSNQEKKTIICDPWAGYVGEIEDVPNDLYVVGISGLALYQSDNKVTMHNSEFLDFVCQNNSCFNNVSCFNLYYAAMMKNHSNDYCKFLRQLPDELTEEYQDSHSYGVLLETYHAFDYANNSKLTFKDLDSKFDEDSIIPPYIDTISTKTQKEIKYYSQPEHPRSYRLIDKSQIHDGDIGDPIQLAKDDVKETIQPNVDQTINIENPNDKSDEESTLQKSPSNFTNTQ